MDIIKVMIVDRQVFSRLGMRHVLSQHADFEVLEGEPNEKLSEVVESESPRVILLDIDAPSLSGLKVGREITRRFPYIRLIMLSPKPDNEELFETIKTGAAAYLDKNSSPKELEHTIREVHRGQYTINDTVLSRPEVAKRILRQFQDTGALGENIETITAPLTKREVSIVTLIAEGNSNKQIAGALGISEQTIKTHVSSILRKLNANDRAHAVVLAIRQGLISLE